MKEGIIMPKLFQMTNIYIPELNERIPLDINEDTEKATGTITFPPNDTRDDKTYTLIVVVAGSETNIRGSVVVRGNPNAP